MDSTSDGLTNEIIFMDLTIRIDPLTNRLTFETFQKAMNLYLYIPPNSAHPGGLLQGLIFGRMRAYWYQNTEKKNFVRMAKLLSQRLIARGYSKKLLTPLFIEAAKRLSRLDSTDKRTSVIATATDASEEKPIFFHLPYHPRGVQRTTIRKTFDTTLKKLLPNRPLTVAVSRQRNLGDRVCRTKLPDVPGYNPSDFL
jgi:hypothetical protein